MSRKNLRRVNDAIGASIVAFCRRRIGARFRMATLLECVMRGRKVAPDSPGRILRHLRQRGVVKYVVVDRRQSLYRVTSVSL